MSSTEDETIPKWTREHLSKEASLRRAPITQELWLAAPVVRHRRGGSRSMHRLVTRLTKELAIIIVNMKAISRQNAAM
ncbi:Hypothetical predicted protein [Olea europaea subsp. europaea]|uniref:Uncharacterized protein n=1 Tax=Olea europaea subsp. europaea TaxID=158383 RepID=A0A8S0Q2Y9_OLEEU|nr:Hypothetical predicted protein [Olea europaea subsp. europaea]